MEEVKSKLRKTKNIAKTTLKRWKNHFDPKPVHFDRSDIEKREEFRGDYRILAESLAKHFNFGTVFDVGCAQGLLMQPMYEKGFDVRGIEVSEDAKELLPDTLKPRVTIGDFQQASGSYDLVCCVEVAEHIAPARSTELVEKVCDLSTKHIYFTAAPPGQGGHGHINCRPHSDWIGWIENRGWKLRHGVTEKLRQDLKSIEHANWLKQNSFIFSSGVS